jgi:hypothetical protein
MFLFKILGKFLVFLLLDKSSFANSARTLIYWFGDVSFKEIYETPYLELIRQLATPVKNN